MENMKNESELLEKPLMPEGRGRGFTLFLIFAVIALLAAAAAIWFSIGSTMNKLTEQADKKNQPSPVPTVTEPQEVHKQPAALPGGTMRLQSLDGSVGQIGKPVTVAVIADSAGDDIVGFDVLVDYNEGQFEFRSATVNASGFKIATSTQKGVLAVSGYKTLGEKNTAVFNNTQIATITLVPKQTGSFRIAPVSSVGKATSKMVTAAKQIILPELDSVNVVISN